MSDTIHFPAASSDHDALKDMFETVSYTEPDPPFELDEHGLPVADPDPDDPDDE